MRISNFRYWFRFLFFRLSFCFFYVINIIDCFRWEYSYTIWRVTYVNTTIRIELGLTRPLLESVSDLPVKVKVSVTTLQHLALILKSQGLTIIENQVRNCLLQSSLPISFKSSMRRLVICCQARVQLPNPLSQQAPSSDPKVRPSLKNQKTQFFGLGWHNNHESVNNLLHRVYNLLHKRV